MWVNDKMEFGGHWTRFECCGIFSSFGAMFFQDVIKDCVNR